MLAEQVFAHLEDDWLMVVQNYFSCELDRPQKLLTQDDNLRSLRTTDWSTRMLFAVISVECKQSQGDEIKSLKYYANLC